MSEAKILYLVIPCYNEEEMLPITNPVLIEKMNALIGSGKISSKSRIAYVNDGSRDRTWELIEKYSEENELVTGISLSRNRGHQNALLAGLHTVCGYCDLTISLDADLQDDINAVDEMIERFYEGYEIVYGVRSSRAKDTFFKRNTALAFYKLMKLLGADIIYNHADYRLMSKRAVEALMEFDEYNIFLRGLVPLVGFKQTTVSYARNERVAGESKYPFKKMLSFALDGITSFSVKPIRMIMSIGVFIFMFSIAMLIYSLIRHFTGHTEIGWSSLIISIWAIGGLQLLAIGVVGEYIGKIYMETKHRPKFIIDRFLEEEINSADKKLTKPRE